MQIRHISNVNKHCTFSLYVRLLYMYEAYLKVKHSLYRLITGSEVFKEVEVPRIWDYRHMKVVSSKRFVKYAVTR